MTGPGQARYLAALWAACARAGLDPRGASVLHIRANAVYHLPREGAVARIRCTPSGPDAILAQLTAAVQVTRWLRGQGFPATEPLDIGQPLIVDGHLATFWRYVSVTGGTGPDLITLGRLLRRLHESPSPAVSLPAASLLGSLRADLQDSTAVAAGEREWLLERASQLEHRYQSTRWVLGTGLIHGDAHVGNLLHAPGGVLLGDWDSVGYGPRELDLVPASMWRRFGRPADGWAALCTAYQVSPRDLAGLPLLQQLRELRGLAAYVRNAADPRFAAELTRRITSLMTGDDAEPWRAL